MGNEFRTEPTAGVAAAPDHPHQRDLPQRRGYEAYAHARQSEPLRHSIHDVASVLGVPAEALPPHVLEAATELLEEIDKLRWQVGQGEQRGAYLEQLADRHPLLPCLNRRAFLRDLGTLLDGGDPALGALAVLHVGGIERLRLAQGMAAAESALHHVCAVMLAELRASDRLGCLGGSDFAVLLTSADAAGANDKLATICRRINRQAFTWAGQAVDLALRAGLHLLVPGEGAEQALGAADRGRRRLADSVTR